jgi:Putative transcriptional repressor regulating G2/M transition
MKDTNIHTETWLICFDTLRGLSLLIEKDLCECWSLSVKFPCVYLCLSCRNFIFSIRVFLLYSYFCCIYLMFVSCTKKFKMKFWFMFDSPSASGSKVIHSYDIVASVVLLGYSSSNTLEAHKRLHLGIRPYKCDICGKSYSQSGNLAYHKSTHSGVKSHVCHLCGKAFLTAGILANHERRHTGLKPFVCDQCGRAFADNYTLTHHKVCFFCDLVCRL